MFKRLMVAVIFIPVIFYVIYGMPAIALPISVSILSMMALYEALWSTGFLRNIRICVLSILLAGVIPFWVFVQEPSVLGVAGMLVYLSLIFLEAVTTHYTVSIEKVGGSFLFVMMIPYFLSSLIRLKSIGDVGGFLVILPFVAAFTSDGCALFAGMLFGKHKLAPDLSPKKTVEGAIGGFIGAMICTMFTGWIFVVGFHAEVNYLYLMIYGGLGSLISQLGDLSFSYIKRQYHVKDFGKVFPGHGGILDRFDSVIFCAPLIEVLFAIIPAVFVLG